MSVSLLDEWLTLCSPYTRMLILYGEINTPHPPLSTLYSRSRKPYGDQLQICIYHPDFASLRMITVMQMFISDRRLANKEHFDSIAYASEA